MTTDVERIAALEVKVSALMVEVHETNKKLDSLLELKNKGAGAFWLATVLVGTSVIGFANFILDWFRT